MSKLKKPQSRFSSAKVAGLLYLVIAIIGGFSIGYIPEELVVYDNAALSIQNLKEHWDLFQLAIAGDIAVLLFETFLTVLLYQLFKSIHQTSMLIASYSRLAMAIIMGMNLINYLIPAFLILEPELGSAFNSAQLESLNLIFLKAHKFGEFAWQIFFAIHLFCLGYVIHRSPDTPKFLGLVMLIGGIAYAGDSILHLLIIPAGLLQQSFSLLLILAVISEFWFAFWLLIKGYTIQAPVKAQP